MPLNRPLPILHDRTSAFSYECRACNKCCHKRGIPVSPYDLIRLAACKGVSTREFRREWMDGNGIYLSQRSDTSCRLLGEAGCTVHADRPLACRLYPLGRVTCDGVEHFVELEPEPGTKGIYGLDGEVADYLEAQGVEPYLSRVAKYRELQVAMEQAAVQSVQYESATGATGEDPAVEAIGWILDPDPIIAAWCEHEQADEPADSEVRCEIHLSALWAWVEGRWTPPTLHRSTSE